ncbi:hypothetical protein WKU33_14025 [Oceanobacillus sp. HCA-5259]|uniref:hypothetical protein n=1 Tax=Oceanobacillus sp. HCA-5259 TaxID=3134661 RepID=UPI0030BA6344
MFISVLFSKLYGLIQQTDNLIDLVIDLEESAEFPEGKEVEFLYAEADGVFIQATEKNKSHEVSHAIVYEGWD